MRCGVLLVVLLLLHLFSDPGGSNLTWISSAKKSWIRNPRQNAKKNLDLRDFAYQNSPGYLKNLNPQRSWGALIRLASDPSYCMVSSGTSKGAGVRMSKCEETREEAGIFWVWCFFLKSIFDPYRLIYWKFLTLQMVCWFPWLANFHQKVKNWMGKRSPFFVEHVSQRAPHWYIRICFFLFQIVVKPNLMATHHLPIQINT